MEKWQNAYVKIENICDQLDSDCRRLKRRLVEGGRQSSHPVNKEITTSDQYREQRSYVNPGRGKQYSNYDNYYEEEGTGRTSPSRDKQATKQDNIGGRYNQSKSSPRRDDRDNEYEETYERDIRDQESLNRGGQQSSRVMKPLGEKNQDFY